MGLVTRTCAPRAHPARTRERLLAEQPLRLAAELLRRLAGQHAGRRDAAPRPDAPRHDGELEQLHLLLGPARREREVPAAGGRAGGWGGGAVGQRGARRAKARRASAAFETAAAARAAPGGGRGGAARLTARRGRRRAGRGRPSAARGRRAAWGRGPARRSALGLARAEGSASPGRGAGPGAPAARQALRGAASGPIGGVGDWRDEGRGRMFLLSRWCHHQVSGQTARAPGPRHTQAQSWAFNGIEGRSCCGPQVRAGAWRGGGARAAAAGAPARAPPGAVDLISRGRRFAAAAAGVRGRGGPLVDAGRGATAPPPAPRPPRAPPRPMALRSARNPRPVFAQNTPGGALKRAPAAAPPPRRADLARTPSRRAPPAHPPPRACAAARRRPGRAPPIAGAAAAGRAPRGPRGAAPAHGG
jgi:hypothetical protein